jgi:hypothetical protein
MGLTSVIIVASWTASMSALRRKSFRDRIAGKLATDPDWA